MSKQDTDETAEIERLAQAATQGPLYACSTEKALVYRIIEKHQRAPAVANTGDVTKSVVVFRAPREEEEALAEYFAFMSPDRALSLTKALREARLRLADAENVLNEFGVATGDGLGEWTVARRIRELAAPHPVSSVEGDDETPSAVKG